MDVDAFATQLLEEARRFLERASATEDESGRSASLHAALLLAFASLEAHLNSIADDFLVRADLPILDRSALAEKDFALDQGRWTLVDRLRMYRIEDRIEHLQNSFSTTPLNKDATSWSQLKEGLALRNRLTHPRQMETVTIEQVARALGAVIDTLDTLYQAIYKRPLPSKQRGPSSSLGF